ncbi:MAG: flippase [Verrucomicrobia bacterium]|nr:flippase [Verrucomicrobiota bacterium]
MSSPRQPLQNILWLVGERVGRATVTAVVLGVVARYLEPAGFGRLNFAVVVVTIGTALATLGLEGIVVDELVKRPGQAGAVLGTAIRLRLLGALGTYGLLAAGAALGIWGGPADARLILIIGTLLAFQPADVVDLWFQRHLDSRRTVLVRFAALVGGGALKLGLVAADAPVVAFAWAQVADVALVASGLWWAGRHNPYSSGAWTWDSAIARELWRRGAPLAVSTLAVALAMRTDQLLVRQWLGAAEAGIYFAASRLTEVALFVGSTMTLSFFPGLSASHAQSREAYRARLQQMFDALTAAGWVVAVSCSVLGPLVVHGLYGTAYARASTVLMVQGWACLFAFSASARWQYILLSAPTMLNLAAAVIHLAVLVLLARWLMPAHGIVGAAAAWLAAVVTSGYLTTWLFPALRPCGPAQTRALLIPVAPARWRALLAQFRS